MSYGKSHHQALSSAYGRDYLIEQGKKNGMKWDEHNDANVNWMRFSGALINHSNSGKHFHMEDSDPDTMHKLLSHYKDLREQHKRVMVPHVRAAMQKLHQDSRDPAKNPMDFLQDVYAHLDANGGHQWAEKVNGLQHLNSHIKKLTQKLTDLGHTR